MKWAHQCMSVCVYIHKYLWYSYKWGEGLSISYYWHGCTFSLLPDEIENHHHFRSHFISFGVSLFIRSLALPVSAMCIVHARTVYSPDAFLYISLRRAFYCCIFFLLASFYARFRFFRPIRWAAVALADGASVSASFRSTMCDHHIMCITFCHCNRLHLQVRIWNERYGNGDYNATLWWPPSCIFNSTSCCVGFFTSNTILLLFVVIPVFYFFYFLKRQSTIKQTHNVAALHGKRATDINENNNNKSNKTLGKLIWWLFVALQKLHPATLHSQRWQQQHSNSCNNYSSKLTQNDACCKCSNWLEVYGTCTSHNMYM